VVTGHHAQAIEPLVEDFPVTIARNADPDAGQAASVRVGLSALSARLDAIIVAPVDQPLVNADDIAALVRAFKQRGDAAMVVPRVGGEPGNPVIFDAALREAWLAGTSDLACRRWRDEHPGLVHWFDADNPRYRVDIDTEDDLAAFERRTGHALRWPCTL